MRARLDDVLTTIKRSPFQTGRLVKLEGGGEALGPTALSFQE